MDALEIQFRNEN